MRLLVGGFQFFASNVETEKIRTCVVSRNVEVEFALDNSGGIQSRDENGFLIVFGSGENFAKRVYDDAAAANQRAVRKAFAFDWIVVWAVFGGHVLACREYEAAALDCDMAHAGLPAVPFIDGWRAVQLDALAVQRHAYANIHSRLPDGSTGSAHQTDNQLRGNAEFGKLARMRRPRPPITFPFPLRSRLARHASLSAAALLVLVGLVPVSADSNVDPHVIDAWLYAPAPDMPAPLPRSPVAEELKPGPMVFPTSARSRSAWLNQSDWLTRRLNDRGLRIGSPVHIRIFKRSRELELYLEGDRGFELYRRYRVCDVSGTLGPKRFEGDLQAPEGFYSIRAERLHPHSEFHLAFNLGYPNDFDQAQKRTGSNIMIHGGCASNGCFAMTDYYMEQIYVLVEAALREGQPEIGVEIYPFRMTDANLTAHGGSRWIEFWRSLRPAHDFFQEHRRPARINAGPDGYVAQSGDTVPGPSKPSTVTVPAASAP